MTFLGPLSTFQKTEIPQSLEDIKNKLNMRIFFKDLQ